MKFILIGVVALHTFFAGCFSSSCAVGQQPSLERKNLAFLATFDSSLTADFARGDRSARFADDVSRKSFLKQESLEGVDIVQGGKFGSAIQFSKKTKQVLTYRAAKNFPYSEKPFDATISFWMKCDPKKLPKGFIDPLQITDKKWNDASIFVDFNDKRPADFRLGVFSDFKHWNPENRKFDSLKPQERPMVDAGQYKFQSDKWVHVGLVFEGINTTGSRSHARLYLDGKLIGDLDRKQKFSWNTEKAFIMLGIYFVGFLDDFAILDVALSDNQVKTLAQSNQPISSLLKK